MNIYLLERTQGASYDEAAGFVVTADDPTQARERASEQAGDEGTATWLARDLTTCRKIGSSEDQSSGVILRDFNAG